MADILVSLPGRQVLVATDLAARGIDAEHVDLVVHVDVPRDAATYLHRVGRAGRFGAVGLSACLACEGDELTDLRAIITRTAAQVRVFEPGKPTLSSRNEKKGLSSSWTVHQT